MLVHTILLYLQKRKEREAAIRRKWLTIITNYYMSSEDSGDDDSITVRPLPWRSNYVNVMFSKIDVYCSHKKSPQARRQMKGRNIGSPSSRLRPADYPRMG